MNHITLLGDSIFDNKTYVGDAPDVVGHLRAQMPAELQATLLAVDGSVVRDVLQQISGIPAGATHLFVSAGGNDALSNIDVLQMKVSSSAEVFNRLADLAGAFENEYRAMLENVLKLGKPTAVCTIYYPRMPEPFVQKIAVAALATFNDVIIRQAFTHKLPLIDLRAVCSAAADYANEIEPSDAGGKKIAENILRVVREHDFSRNETRIYF